MNNYRLHIDIPLGTDENTAKDIAYSILQWSFFDDKNQTKIVTNSGKRNYSPTKKLKLKVDVEKVKRNGLIHEEIWQYCYYYLNLYSYPESWNA